MSAEQLLLGAMADQEARWAKGERPALEDYVERWPDLRDSNEHLLDLIYHEVLLRERNGEEPHFDDYRQRFPHLSDELDEQFQVHAALNRPKAQISTRETLRSLTEPSPVLPRITKQQHFPVVPGYEILRFLGRGAMGKVFLARDLKLRRLVALKFLQIHAPPGDPVEQRFRKEAQAVAALHDPGIVQIYEFNEHLAEPFFALEYVPGGSLDEQLTGKPQPLLAATRLVERIARAVSVAHRAGIVHCDLKPANILLTSEELLEPHANDAVSARDPEAKPTKALPLELAIPKVGDFGLAWRLNLDPTASRQVLGGTILYMAPEQIHEQGDKISPATDVHALGVIFYELLTGRVPYAGETLLEVLEQAERAEPVPPSQLVPKLPLDLETICLKCLRQDPERRYANGQELADDMKRYLEGRPILARPVAKWEQGWRWCKRNPVVAALAASVLFILVAGISSTTYAAVKAIDYAGQAETKATAAGIAEGRATKAANDARTAEELERKQREKLTRLVYAHLFQQAEAEVNQGHWGEAARLLDECPEEERGIEWYVLRRISQGSDETFLVPGGVRTLSCGLKNRVLVQSWDNLRGPIIVDLAAGKVVAEFPPIKSTLFTSVDAAQYSPDATLIAVLRNREVEIWDADLKQKLRSIPATCFAWQPGSRHLVVETEPVQPLLDLPLAARPKIDREIRLIAAETGETISRFAAPFDSYADGDSRFRWTSDGERLLIRGGNQFAFWNRRSGQIKQLQFAPALSDNESHEHHDLSADGRWLIVQQGYSDLIVYDLSQPAPLAGRMMRMGEGVISSLAISPQSSLLAVGVGNELRLLDLEEKRELGRRHGHNSYIHAIAWKRDGRALLTGDLPTGSSHSTSGSLRLWEILAAPSETTRQFPASSAIAFSPDGRRIATCLPGKAVVYDAATGVTLFEVPYISDDPLADKKDSQNRPLVYGLDPFYAALALLPDDSLLTLNNAGVLRWHDGRGRNTRMTKIQLDTIPPEIRLFFQGSQELSCVLSPNGKLAAIVADHGGYSLENGLSVDGQSRGIVVNADTGKTVFSFSVTNDKSTGGSIGATQCQFSRDGSQLWLSSGSIADGTWRTRIWDTATGKPIELPRLQRDPDSQSVPQLAERRRVVVDNKRAYLVDARTQRPLLRWPGTGQTPLRDAAISPDGKSVALIKGDEQPIPLGQERKPPVFTLEMVTVPFTLPRIAKLTVTPVPLPDETAHVVPSALSYLPPLLRREPPSGLPDVPPPLSVEGLKLQQKMDDKVRDLFGLPPLPATETPKPAPDAPKPPVKKPYGDMP